MAIKRSNKNLIIKKSIKTSTPSYQGVKVPKTSKKSNLDVKSKKGKGQQGTQRGALPNPFNNEFQSLTLDQQLEAYRLLRGRVNQQFRQLEKQGIAEFSQAYISARDAGELMKTGNIGYASKFRQSMLKATKKNPVPMTESELKKELTKEYSKIYRIQSGKSLYTKKAEVADMLAQKGIDIDNFEELSEAKEELVDYWNLYDELKKAGVFEVFDLKSDEAQDIVNQYRATNPANSKYKEMAKDIKQAMEEAKSINNPDELPDATVYDYFFNTENVSEYIEEPSISKLDAETRRLAKMLAKQNYGTRPVKPSFVGGLGSIARHFASKK